MDKVECPYCNRDVEINHDDGAHYDENERESQWCSNCDKYFMVSASCSWYYQSEKADCLNDDQHDYQLTTTYPKVASRMRCSMCDDERRPTAEEREKYQLDVIL